MQSTEALPGRTDPGGLLKSNMYFGIFQLGPMFYHIKVINGYNMIWSSSEWENGVQCNLYGQLCTIKIRPVKMLIMWLQRNVWRTCVCLTKSHSKRSLTGNSLSCWSTEGVAWVYWLLIQLLLITDYYRAQSEQWIRRQRRENQLQQGGKFWRTLMVFLWMLWSTYTHGGDFTDWMKRKAQNKFHFSVQPFFLFCQTPLITTQGRSWYF